MSSQEDLKKRQRLLDNDRLRYQQAAQTQMNKQSENIGSLKKENEKMKQELAATTGGSYDFAQQDRLSAMQSEMDQLESKVHVEKMRKNDMAKKLSVSRMETMKSRRGMGGVNVTTENTQAVDKQVRVLENRLDQALVKFNEALSYNKDLREQIDNLREERKVFQRIYKKLEAELHEKKKAMADKIERANQDYEERDTLLQQLEALRGAAKEDQKKYEENFANIEAAMQQFKAVRDQQLQSMKAANNTANNTNAGSNNNTMNNNKDRGGSEPSSPTHRGKGGNMGGTADHNRSMGHGAEVDNAYDEEHDLQEVVDQLKEATGIQDLDVLYHKFVKAEEHNFSLYNFVNELNTEQEALEGEIAQLKEQLESEKGDVQRRKMLKELENELAHTEQQCERLQADTSKNKENLGLVRGVTQSVFTRIGCSPDDARTLCGVSECNELTLLPFLGLIEQRTNDILVAYQNAAQNERRRRLQSKDEEARRRKERKQAERQARIEAGETLPPQEDDEEEEPQEEGESSINEASTAAADQQATTKGKFIGVPPSVPHNSLNASQLVRQHGLPNTNAGDAQADANDDVDEDNVLSHEVLRQQMEQRLQQRREKDERGGRGGKKKGDRNKPAQPR